MRAVSPAATEAEQGAKAASLKSPCVPDISGTPILDALAYECPSIR